MKSKQYLHLGLMLIPFVVGLTCNWYLFFWPCVESEREAPVSENLVTTTPESVGDNNEMLEKTMKRIEEGSKRIHEFLEKWENNRTSDRNNSTTAIISEVKQEEIVQKPNNVRYIREHGSSFAIVATYMHSQMAALNLILFFESRQCCCFWNYFVKWIYPIYISWEAQLYVVVSVVYLIYAGKDCPVAGISLTVAGFFSVLEMISFWVAMCYCCRKDEKRRDLSPRCYALLAILALFCIIRYTLLFFLVEKNNDTLMFNLAESFLLTGSILINIRHLLREAGVRSKNAFWLISGGEISAITGSSAIALFYAVMQKTEGLIPALTVIMITIDVVVFQFFGPPAEPKNAEDRVAIFDDELFKDTSEL